MRYAIFSDIHGNLQATESVLQALKKEKVDAYLCVGDVVGYGANPHECIDQVKDVKAICVAGNHDLAVVSRISTQYFNSLAREAVLWTRANILQKDKDFLRHLSFTYKNEDFVLVHGTLNEPEHFHYLTDQWQARETFHLMDRPLCFVGHSHVAGVFTRKKETVRYLPLVDRILEKDYQYIVNVGSVGQPRDGNPMAAYCIFDTDTKKIFVKRVNYDIQEAQRRIFRAGLPGLLASRLSTGQ